jgi:hypothetical protein
MTYDLDDTRALLLAQMQITQHLHEQRRADVAELERLRAMEQRARRRLNVTGPADLHAREVAREILGEST